MRNKPINKIAFLISWPREIDMFSNLIKVVPSNKVEVLVNDINSLESGRSKSNKLIPYLLKKNNIKFKRFSNIYKKKKYKILISTGEASASKVTLYSLIRFFYSISIGLILEKTKIYKILFFLFKRPFTGGGLNCKVGLPWFPEKDIAETVIKFPDGADIKQKNYPYDYMQDIFDIFLSYSDKEIRLIQKKFKKKKCKKIDYFRYLGLTKSKNYLEDLTYHKYFKKKKKILYWLPTHIDIYKEEDQNILLWYKKLSFLKNKFNLIIRPHPKTILRNKTIIKKLKKEKFIIDKDHNRKIGNIIQASDVVLCDYGGTVFSSIFLNKSLSLLNLPDDYKYVLDLKLSKSLDINIRGDLSVLNLNDQKKTIDKKILMTLNFKYKKKINNLKKKYFGSSKAYSVYDLSSFLINLLNKKSYEN